MKKKNEYSGGLRDYLLISHKPVRRSMANVEPAETFRMKCVFCFHEPVTGSAKKKYRNRFPDHGYFSQRCQTVISELYNNFSIFSSVSR